MKTCSWILIAIVAFAMAPLSAEAADLRSTAISLTRKVGIHGNISVRHPTDADVSRGVTFGPSVGLSPGNTNGWKFPVALSFFRQNLHSPSGTQFGSVRTRAVLVGVGYGWHVGRLTVGPQIAAGYAFNHASVDDDAAAAFGPSGPATVHADNAWLLRPEFKAEYFITPKMTFRSSIDYVHLQPDIAMTTAAGVISDQWNLSNVHANIGIGFYPFRK